MKILRANLTFRVMVICAMATVNDVKWLVSHTVNEHIQVLTVIWELSKRGGKVNEFTPHKNFSELGIFKVCKEI